MNINIIYLDYKPAENKKIYTQLPEKLYISLDKEKYISYCFKSISENDSDNILSDKQEAIIKKIFNHCENNNEIKNDLRKVFSKKNTLRAEAVLMRFFDIKNNF